MELFYVPTYVGDSSLLNDIRNISGSFEATAEDLPLIKDVLREVMPDSKPTLRMEYLARSFGYRTAAAMQAALKQATTECPLVLTPVIGRLDNDALDLFLKTCPEPTIEAFEVAHAVSHSVSESRGRPTLADIAPWFSCRQHIVTRLKKDQGLSFIPDLASPDLRVIFNETSWFEADELDHRQNGIPEGWIGEYLVPEKTNSDDLDDIHIDMVAGESLTDDLPVVYRPIINRNDVKATIVLKNGLRDVVGFVTFSFTMRPFSEAEAETIIQTTLEGYGYQEDKLAKLRQEVRCQSWYSCLRVEAVGYRSFSSKNHYSETMITKRQHKRSEVNTALLTFLENALYRISVSLEYTIRLKSVAGLLIFDLVRDERYVDQVEHELYAAHFYDRFRAQNEFCNEGFDDDNYIELKVYMDGQEYAP